MTEHIKEIWNTSKSTKKQQSKLTEELLLAPTFEENFSKKVDREIRSFFRFLATVNRQFVTLPVPESSPRCFILIGVFSICVNCGRFIKDFTRI